MTSRVLFICKNRDKPLDSGAPYSHGGKSSGLLNSVNFMVDLLNRRGVEAKVVDVVDNNAIDREVKLYQPTQVIIEALWVVPEKFEVLTKLHPKVHWIVRLHSEVPFLAGEGIAFEWIPKYYNYQNVKVAANSKYLKEDLEEVYGIEVLFLPNFYPIEDVPAPSKKRTIYNLMNKFKKVHPNSLQATLDRDDLHIGCFGAIRPLKNQMIQAVAAIRFANEMNKTLHFHINGNRIEGKGEPFLKNIRSLFAAQTRHKLVEHAWMPHSEFTTILSQMDFTLQVSFTETYNIVAADSIASGVPVITSSEITFTPKELHADPTDTNDIIAKMKHLYTNDYDQINMKSYLGLLKDADEAAKQWSRFLFY